MNYEKTGNAPITGIGWLYNNDGHGNPLYTTFFGQPTPLDCLILRYTYMGDTLLRGFVNSSDLATVASAMNGSPSPLEARLTNSDGFPATSSIPVANRTCSITSGLNQLSGSP